LRARLVLAALAALCVVPATAGAATVNLNPGTTPGVPVMVEYAAAPGENNKLDVTVNGRTAEINDPGATITAGDNCASVNPKKVTCTSPTVRSIDLASAELGDGNDTFAITGTDAFVGGGPGDDEINGGAGSDSLRGGGGTDTLNGGAARDTLSDEDTSGAANKDTLVGGDGNDFVSYATRTAGVTVNLGTGVGGEPGENDALSGFENVSGGAGNDTLLGDAGPNGLATGPGDDEANGFDGVDSISGFDGNDTLIGGPGRDDIEGGEGNDTLRLENPLGQYDRLLTCDDGKDTIVGIAAAPSVSIGCELGDFGFGFVNNLKPKKVGTKEVTLKIACPEAYRKNGVCKGSVVVEPKSAYSKSAAERKKNRFGVAKFAIDGASGKVKIKLNSKGQKELKKSAFKLQFHINLKETATGTKREFEWTSYLVRAFL
jgi:Ca2+-binding RTX toxin-like protein